MRLAFAEIACHESCYDLRAHIHTTHRIFRDRHGGPRAFFQFFPLHGNRQRDFFEAAGVDLISTQPGELVGWPRARAQCKFTAPLRFGDTIDIHLAVKAVKDRSIDFQYRIFRKNADGTRTQAAKANITTILTKLDENGDLQSIELPEDVRTRITEAPAAVLGRPGGA